MNYNLSSTNYQLSTINKKFNLKIIYDVSSERPANI